MRHFKRKLRIIMDIIGDSYTNSDRQNRWWLWRKYPDGEHITIIFDDKFHEDKNA